LKHTQHLSLEFNAQAVNFVIVVNVDAVDRDSRRFWMVVVSAAGEKGRDPVVLREMLGVEVLSDWRRQTRMRRSA